MPVIPSAQELSPGYYLIIPSTGSITSGPFATEALATAAITGAVNTGTAIVRIIGAVGSLTFWGCGSVFGTVLANVTAA